MREIGRIVTIHFFIRIIFTVLVAWVLEERTWGATSSGQSAALESPGPSTRRGPWVISEIMYHPLPQPNGADLEFIELYNSSAWPEDLSGFRVAGDVDYMFPARTLIPARSTVVLARVPGDVAKTYGLTNVFGPWEGKLSNDEASIRLLNELGAVQLELKYETRRPWPEAADGWGHSLSIVRPSYGEGDPQAWAASDLVGGSPGRWETFEIEPSQGICFNEWFSGNGLGNPEGGYVELFNSSSAEIELQGCLVTDGTVGNTHIFETSTVLKSGGFLKLTEGQLGFNLDPKGGWLVFWNASRTRVIDLLWYPSMGFAQAWGRVPNGGEAIGLLKTATAGASNAGLQVAAVVINEIMYQPISGDPADEYVELFNPSSETVLLDGWCFTAGIKFEFPANTPLPAGGYLVVAKNRAQLLTNYPSLNPAVVVGDFGGTLNGAGERLALASPQGWGVDRYWVVEDEVTYGVGGAWGNWANGGGSSLERRSPQVSGRWAVNWGDSDESEKAPWTGITSTGNLDLGVGTINSLHVLLQDAGECLVDDLVVIRANSTNSLYNGDFSTGTNYWIFQGTHDRTTLEEASGIQGSRALHLRASHRGDNSANRLRGELRTGFSTGANGTIRAQARWLKGSPYLLLRLQGNYLEAAGKLIVPKNLGSPGLANSALTNHLAPQVGKATHRPVLPQIGEAIEVSVQAVGLSGAVTNVVLRYRIDPSTNLISAPMADDGEGSDVVAADGFFSGIIPSQASGKTVAFSIVATDNQGFTRRFPANTREALVRVGELHPTNTLGSYRLWLTDASVKRWTAREKLSNQVIDGTIVYGDERVIYEAGAYYAGSPWHSPGYNGPTGSAQCGYIFQLPEDDQLLGTKDFSKMHAPGNGGDDEVAQREQTSYWMMRRMGLPFNYARFATLTVNGNKRGKVFEDLQVPGAEYLRQWFPEDAQGDLYKISTWFEFDKAGTQFSDANGAAIANFVSGGKKKVARYRWNWQKRGSVEDPNDYSTLFELMDTLLTTSTGPQYTSKIEALIDVEEWMRMAAIERLVGDWDTWLNGGGQNMYAYKPKNDRWKLLKWDLNIDLGIGGYGSPANSDLFLTGDNALGRLMSHPPFKRVYLRALVDAMNGPLLATNYTPVIDGRYAGFSANKLSISAPTVIKTYIETRRKSTTTVLAPFLKVPLTISTSSGTDFSTDSSTVLLSGSAPVDIKTIQVNNVEAPVTWTTVTNWTLVWPLRLGANVLSLQGYGTDGNMLSNQSQTVTITSHAGTTYNNHVVINEWMARNDGVVLDPLNGSARDWFELYNPTDLTVDLSGWRVSDTATNITHYFLPSQTQMKPKSYLLIWADGTSLGLTPDGAIHVNFKLNEAGEEIALFSATGELVDYVRFGPLSPNISQGRWPDGSASFLILMDQPSPQSANALNGLKGLSPQVTSVRQNATSVTLSWRSEAGRRYHVQYRTNVNEPLWRNLAGDVDATGPESQKTDSSIGTSSNRFYRIMLVP